MTMYEYEMELDENYYQQLLNADFFEKEGIVFVKGLVKNFDEALGDCLKHGQGKTEIEMYMNHIMMEFVSTFYEKQKKLAENIIKKWKKKLKEKFPAKKFVFELIDSGSDYVIYLYTERKEKWRKGHQKKDNRIFVRRV